MSHPLRERTDAYWHTGPERIEGRLGDAAALTEKERGSFEVFFLSASSLQPSPRIRQCAAGNTLHPTYSSLSLSLYPSLNLFFLFVCIIHPVTSHSLSLWVPHTHANSLVDSRHSLINLFCVFRRIVFIYCSHQADAPDAGFGCLLTHPILSLSLPQKGVHSQMRLEIDNRKKECLGWYGLFTKRCRFCLWVKTRIEIATATGRLTGRIQKREVGFHWNLHQIRPFTGAQFIFVSSKRSQRTLETETCDLEAKQAPWVKSKAPRCKTGKERERINLKRSWEGQAWKGVICGQQMTLALMPWRDKHWLCCQGR